MKILTSDISVTFVQKVFKNDCSVLNVNREAESRALVHATTEDECNRKPVCSLLSSLTDEWGCSQSFTVEIRRPVWMRVQMRYICVCLCGTAPLLEQHCGRPTGLWDNRSWCQNASNHRENTMKTSLWCLQKHRDLLEWTGWSYRADQNFRQIRLLKVKLRTLQMQIIFVCGLAWSSLMSGSLTAADERRPQTKVTCSAITELLPISETSEHLKAWHSLLGAQINTLEMNQNYNKATITNLIFEAAFALCRYLRKSAF